MGITKFVTGSVLFVQLYNNKILVGSCLEQPLRFYEETGLAVDTFHSLKLTNVVEIILSLKEDNKNEIQISFVTTGPFNPSIIPSLTIPREQIFTVSSGSEDIVSKYVEFLSKEAIKSQQCVADESQSVIKQ